MLTTKDEGQQSEKLLQDVLRFADWRPGNTNFFEQLVLHLAEALAVDIVLTGEFVVGREHIVRTVALCDSGRIVQNEEYKMAARLADELTHQEISYYPTFDQNLFDADCFLTKYDAESCFGMLLRNTAGEKVGFILAADRKPMPDRDLAEVLFRVVASQTTIELERRDKDQKLRESEERYRIISELISDYAFSIRIEPDGSMVVEWVTDTFTRMTGYTFPEIADREGLQRLSIFHPEDKAAVSIDLAQLLQGKNVVNEYRILTKSGEVRWFLLNRHPVWDTIQGRVVRYYGIAQDVTQRKQAEEALASLFETQHDQRTLAEALRDSAAAVSSLVNIEDILDRILADVARVVPYDAASVMLVKEGKVEVAWSRGWGKRLLQDWVEQTHLTFDAFPNWKRMLTSKSPRPFLVQDTRADPDWVVTSINDWIRSSAKAPIHVGGNLIGILHLDSKTPNFYTEEHLSRLESFAYQAAVAVHNAQLLQAERRRRQIAETLTRAAAVLNSTLELKQVLNLILQQLREVISYESASCQLLETDDLVIVACEGFETVDQVVGVRFPLVPKFPNTRVIEEKRPLVLEDVTAAFPHFHDEAEEYGSGKIRVWLGVPLLTRGRAIGMITVDRVHKQPFSAEDVNLAMAFANQAAIAVENARLYEQVQRHASDLEARVKERTAQWEAANEELRVLSRIKDEFVSNVSHNLRTPIAVLKVRHYLLEAQPEKLSVHLPVLERETERLARTIDDLLTLSRIDQNNVSFHLQALNLTALVAQFVADRAPLTEQRNLELLTDFSSGDLMVQADQGMLEQVLSALLTNARNYTPAGGHITVKTFKDQDKEKRWACISVHDTGPGISKEEQGKLFTRFMRGEAGQKSKEPGTGLGLAIAKEIITRHQGHISIESSGQPGEGATFTICLPIDS